MPEHSWKIDFLIPTFNRPQKLHHILSTGLALNIEGARFVVLDDGSWITEEVSNFGHLTTEKVIDTFQKDQIIYLKSPSNIGLVANMTNYYQNHCCADYTILVTDKDQYVSKDPIINAIKKMDADSKISMVVIPILQNDQQEKDELLSFDYQRMSGSQFIKRYIDDTMLQHAVGYSVMRVSSVKKAGVPRSLNLRSQGLEDSFGFDLDYFLMTAATGDVDFESKPHICRTILGGLTERYPLSFAYCYYQYAKRSLHELYKKKIIDWRDLKKSILWWNLIMLRGLVVVYQPSLRRSEKDTSRVRRHLKIPIIFYLLMQYAQYRIWPTKEMRTLLFMHFFSSDAHPKGKYFYFKLKQIARKIS